MSGFLVDNGGVQSCIQDAGRRGFSDIGLTQSGAMDEMAFGYANFYLTYNVENKFRHSMKFGMGI